MTTAILLGAGFGLGLFGLVRLLLPSRPGLAAALARVDAAASTPAARWQPATDIKGGPLRRRVEAVQQLLGDRVAGQLAERGLLGGRLRHDLALLGVDERAYTARKLLAAAGVLVVSPLLLVPAAVLLDAPWLIAAWISVLLALAAFVLPDARMRSAAADRRRDFTAAVAAYLDLVAMRAASGSGVAEALRDAAAVGTGPAFARLRAALDDARPSGLSPARALGRLGDELDVAELRQLSSQLQLIDTSGAQAEATLRAKAEAVRGRQLSDARGGANARSQTMAIGQVWLLAGFVIFLVYPAVAQVLSL